MSVRVPGHSAQAVARRLRAHEPPVIARIQEDEVVLDMRTLMAGDDAIVVDAVCGLTTEAS